MPRAVSQPHVPCVQRDQLPSGKGEFALIHQGGDHEHHDDDDGQDNDVCEVIP